MADAEWEFEKSCEEGADTLFAELVYEIKQGKPEKYPTDRILQAADDEVMHFIYRMHEFTRYLEEYWDEVRTEETADAALRGACYRKADEFIGSRFQEIGGEELLEEIADVWQMWLDAKDEDGKDPVSALEELIADYPVASEHLKLEEIKEEIKAAKALRPSLKP